AGSPSPETIPRT
nr:immunoglobulin heavy chain junction region [Homo sapiens]MBN4517685.1 immunoglobulin heavy chain junction region [Homo sapiens]